MTCCGTLYFSFQPTTKLVERSWQLHFYANAQWRDVREVSIPVFSGLLFFLRTPRWHCENSLGFVELLLFFWGQWKVSLGSFGTFLLELRVSHFNFTDVARGGTSQRDKKKTFTTNVSYKRIFYAYVQTKKNETFTTNVPKKGEKKTELFFLSFLLSFFLSLCQQHPEPQYMIQHPEPQNNFFLFSHPNC